MATRRNDPCPCGSGKKYKKCCLARDEAESARQQNDSPASSSQWAFVETDLDRLSNSVIDLIGEGKIDEAEKTSKELLERFPDHVDGLERLAEVYKAKGDNPKAVEYLRKAAHFMQARPGEYDEEYTQSLLEKVDKLESA